MIAGEMDIAGISSASGGSDWLDRRAASVQDTVELSASSATAASGGSSQESANSSVRRVAKRPVTASPVTREPIPAAAKAQATLPQAPTVPAVSVPAPQGTDASQDPGVVGQKLTQTPKSLSPPASAEARAAEAYAAPVDGSRYCWIA